VEVNMCTAHIHMGTRHMPVATTMGKKHIT